MKNGIFQAISRSFLKLFAWSYDLYFAATYIKKIHHVISDHKRATGLLDGTYRQVNKPWPDNWRFFLILTEKKEQIPHREYLEQRSQGEVHGQVGHYKQH